MRKSIEKFAKLSPAVSKGKKQLPKMKEEIKFEEITSEEEWELNTKWLSI